MELQRWVSPEEGDSAFLVQGGVPRQSGRFLLAVGLRGGIVVKTAHAAFCDQVYENREMKVWFSGEKDAGIEVSCYNHLPLFDLRRIFLPRFHDDFLRGLNVTIRSRNNVHKILSSVFSYARARGYLPVSERTAAEILPWAKTKPPLIGILTPNDFAAVLKAATRKTLPSFVLGGFCGIRQAEICRLDWSAVDFDRKLITVNANIAKTSRRRLVPLHDAAATWLKPIAKPAGRVIEYSSAINLSIMMRPAWKAAKVKPTQNLPAPLRRILPTRSNRQCSPNGLGAGYIGAKAHAALPGARHQGRCRKMVLHLSTGEVDSEEFPLGKNRGVGHKRHGQSSRSGIFWLEERRFALDIPARENMTAKELGQIIKKRRISLAMTQADLALVSGTGVRFISDLENGKETCVIGKTLKAMESLGMDPVIRSRDQK